MLVINILVLGLVSLAAAYDLFTKKIPNFFSLVILTLGIAANTFLPDGIGFWHSIFGFLTGFGFMLLFYCIASLGAGDVKLVAALGSVMGYKAVIYIAAYSYVISGLFALIYLLLNKYGNLINYKFFLSSDDIKNQKNKKKPDISTVLTIRMPMAPAIALVTGYKILGYIT